MEGWVRCSQWLRLTYSIKIIGEWHSRAKFRDICTRGHTRFLNIEQHVFCFWLISNSVLPLSLLEFLNSYSSAPPSLPHTYLYISPDQVRCILHKPSIYSQQSLFSLEGFLWPTIFSNLWKFYFAQRWEAGTYFVPFHLTKHEQICPAYVFRSPNRPAYIFRSPKTLLCAGMRSRNLFRAFSHHQTWINLSRLFMFLDFIWLNHTGPGGSRIFLEVSVDWSGLRFMERFCEGSVMACWFSAPPSGPIHSTRSSAGSARL